MILDWLAVLADGLIIGTTLLIVIGINNRWMIVTLAVQYLAVFMLVLLSWPFSLALVKLVEGWMAAAIISTAFSSLERATEFQLPSEQGPAETFFLKSSRSKRLFRMFTALLMLLFMAGFSIQLNTIFPGLVWMQSMGALVLLGLGIIQICLSDRLLMTICGLLTVLSGFEVIYAVIETSTLVAGLLASVILGIAIISAYLFGLQKGLA